ncbi:phosphatase PAP2 family protein [Nesterenkonia ebinurensis]|uniref:phosphatase PAP2 family protein n=1 Tax=Nesterenkonia ebinurensis TaxID=2608252 RepID=UPI00168BC53B|nr:phosphatase PAP2 family protein [Nesterenkonia ebinurensis]
MSLERAPARIAAAGTAAGSEVLRQREGLHFLLRQVPLVLIAVAVYFGVRNLTEGDVVTATRNAELLIDVQEWLGINVELEFQDWALSIPGVLELMNWIYIWGHWPVIAAVLGWLAWKRRDAFLVYRNTLLISGLVGMLIVATFPMAPPRLLDLGFLDTVSMHSEAYRVLQPPSFTNQYAAMPSFHFGWDLLMGIALVREAPACWTRCIGVVLPVLMLLSILITGNHFFLDAVVGGGIVVVALAAAQWYQQARQSR